MKNILIHTVLICAFFLMGNQSIAQKLIMENDKISYDDQMRSAVKVTIAPERGDVRDDWEDFIEDNFDAKVKGNGWLRKKDVLSAKEFMIPTISNNKIDLYAKVIDKGEGSQVYVFAAFGYDLFITPEVFPKEYRALENLTLDFLDEILTDYYKDAIEDSNELVNELKNKRKELKENLVENKEEIVDLKEDNVELEKEINLKNEEIQKALATLDLDRKNLALLRKQLTSSNYFGKKVFTLGESEISYEDDTRIAVTVTMQPDKKNVRDAWEDFLEDDYDTKTKGNGFIGKDDVIRAEETNLSAISNKTIDLYAEILEKGEGSEMKVFASLGYDIHITPEKFPKEYAALEDFTLEFLNDFLIKYYEEKVEDAKKVVYDLRDDKNDMQEKMGDNKSEIVDLKEENLELQEGMTAKGAALKKANQTLETKKVKKEKVQKKIEVEKSNNSLENKNN